MTEQGAPIPDSPTVSEIEGFLTYQVSILAKLIDRRTIRLLSENFGLKLAEWRVLAQLSNQSPNTVRSLAQRMRMDRADVSRAAAALIARGYVERRQDEADARSALFLVTPAGLARYQEVLPSRIAENRRMDALLTEDEGEMFRSVIDRLTEALSEDPHEQY